MSTPRIRLPDTAAAGEAIEIRTLIDHPMITGVSSDDPRDMLDRLEIRMNDMVIFTHMFENGSAANPTITLHVTVAETGRFDFVWTHEDGTEFTAEGQVTVV